MTAQIVAGDEIESMFGARLGISTLAAAGLGNLISDVIGLGMAEPVQVSGSMRVAWFCSTNLSPGPVWMYAITSRSSIVQCDS